MILLTLVSVHRWIGASVRLLNRVCRHCREASSVVAENDAAICKVGRESERFNATVEALRREEQSIAARYSQRGCSADDVIRAKAIRVQAEIALLLTCAE
ncbi:hypothetical protein K227x_17010 [Rubripirellula lacrimiformis]|uniref:Uncharacterized protein n=1 Tax=Rubripirellula lacrimiformis TaxID=1930273 RepID=A0A517N858_9BACT|nr:hypothetical protein [Rubripirellula lacrimiformis]QDT03319.1 hypothetical protein K227x_17010 [Rubripirellula lacrimiformis]